MADGEGRTPPIVTGKRYDRPSTFTPENLLREARRQKRLEVGSVPDVCILDPDGSYHYLPPAEYSEADRELIGITERALAGDTRIRVGATWTTDAPFRETQAAIDAALAAGILAVEMEAAGLYAFAKARNKSVLCFAHVTNQMALIEGDFEKGFADGAEASLRVISVTAHEWLRGNND